MIDENLITPSPSVSAAKTRVLTAAMDLFCKHGVAGTSLQMIANEVGVTKAAVYHQFPTKDEIVNAIGISIAQKLEEKANRAASQTTKQASREVLIDGMIQIAVRNRRVAAFVQNDPIMVRFIREHESYTKITARLNAILLQGAKSARARTAVAMMQTAIGGAVLNPLIADLSEEDLAKNLKTLCLELASAI